MTKFSLNTNSQHFNTIYPMDYLQTPMEKAISILHFHLEMIFHETCVAHFHHFNRPLQIPGINQNAPIGISNSNIHSESEWMFKGLIGGVTFLGVCLQLPMFWNFR
ncbi:hypothetical protein TNCT_375281 [Trichonephila clavata]|uniref:Uncharacterized protein n=1 Tax=Trichonephila clavata TaxID=2740835 RepID=A0A8X6F2V6_TRICU|nr:hypothetical protein TNCT_375281 [Trichonephila clavata]